MVKTNVRCAGASDPGRIRGNNEDAFHLDADRGIFLVVDGIGGQNAGEKAAAIAVERVRARLERQTGSVEQRVREAIAMANNEILRTARANTEYTGMACVLTLVVLENGIAVVGHVGDSRLYLLRGGEIRKITHDHSPVGEREDNRELNEAEAMRHPRRNEVYRDVGSEEHTPADTDFMEVRTFPFDGDAAFLLCSDGLSDQVPSAQIRESVERHAGNPDAAVRELIEAANRAGGKDNVTVVIVEGERFTAPAAVVSAPVARQEGWGSRALLFAGGFVLAMALGWLTRAMWQPAPVTIVPRTIAVTGTIAAAMADARAGDTVEVPEGEYREQVQLKSGVTLRARVPREPKLWAAPLSSGPAVIAEGVKGARFSGFRILADAATPLTIGISVRDSVVEIDDVEVKGAGVGIEIRGAGNSAVRASAIRDCLAEGMLLMGPNTPWLSHNLLQGNKAAGVAARDGSKPSLLGNTFDRNVLEPSPSDAVKALNSFIAAPAAPGRAARVARQAGETKQ
ncbi:MAG: protein phosphatase 2C domain-containing protein [Candidatus Solibacter sp.]